MESTLPPLTITHLPIRAIAEIFTASAGITPVTRAGMVWRTEDSREVEVEVVWTRADLSNLPASVGLVRAHST